MKTTNLLLKNMVCDRCIRVVREELQSLGHETEELGLGYARLVAGADEAALRQIETRLQASGFELIHDPKKELVERVKQVIIQHLHHGKEKPTAQNFSDFLEQEIGLNYFSLSKLFSVQEGTTIEKYLILQKIERVKELLRYGEQTLSEIAFELAYSSVAHLSGQFKKVTGMTPSQFKKSGVDGRNALDKL